MKKWDIYFLRIAKEVAKNSKCMSRKIGAVLVRDNSIISTGYNGAPRGVKHCNERKIEFYEKLDDKKLNKKIYTDNYVPGQCPRRLFCYDSGKGLHLCQAGHAERNALIQAARNGVSTKGTTLYCACCLPCKDCIIEIINAGVKRLVYLKGEVYDKYSEIILKESGIDIFTVDESEAK